MLSPEIEETIANGALPPSLDYNGTYQVFTSQTARNLSIPDDDWESPLDQIDMEELILEPPASWHMVTGPWDKLVTVDMTAGISPHDGILISAVMYPAESIHRETVTDRDNKLAQALIYYSPASEYTREVINRYLQVN